jgi:DNA-binding MltR family transcriptional regulator
MAPKQLTPGSLRRLKELAKRIPDEGTEFALLRTLEDSRAHYPIAIIGAAMIERALEVAITSRFVPLDKQGRNLLFDYEQKGLLADLGARIRMGCALGLFGPKTFADLEAIRHIRNLFAHAPSPRGFDDEEVSEACRHLSRSIRRFAARPSLARTDSELYIEACIEISSHLRERHAIEPEFPMWDDLLP